MEGFSIINYNATPIVHFDYTNIGESKEKVFQLLQYALEEFTKHPPKSILVLANFTNLHVDMDVVNAFKDQRLKLAPYTKKIAVLDIRGTQKIAYDFIVGFTQTSNGRLFESEIEAKEWLISDN